MKVLSNIGKFVLVSTFILVNLFIMWADLSLLPH